MSTTAATLSTFNALFSNSTPTSPPSRYATTPQTKKVRNLEARSRRTPRGERKEPAKQPQTTSVSRSAGSSERQQARTPPSKSAPTTPERWANGLISPPPSALPIPCFDDDDDVVIQTVPSRPASSAQRQLVFA